MASSSNAPPPLPEDTTEWVANAVYWDAEQGFKVKLAKSATNKGGFQRFRVCEEGGCTSTTKAKDEACCLKHGGAQLRPTCKTDGCTNQSSLKGFCPGCFCEAFPDKACPGCGKQPMTQSRDDKLCRNCVRYKAVADRRNEGEAAAEQMAAEHGLQRAPSDPRDAQPRTRYVHVSHMTGYVPYFAVLGGRVYKSACAHEKCHQVAIGAKKSGGFCSAHGGGLRCKGYQKPGEEPKECPTGVHGIGINTSTNRYDGRCVCCFCYTFPNDPRAVEARRWFKAKEQAVVQALTDRFPEYEWKLDERFAVGVEKRPVKKRPDMLLETRRRILIVEIDEHSHLRVLCASERARELEFLNAKHPNSVIAMIRFNPDSYECGYTHQKFPSCFRFNEASGTVTVDPAQKAQWQQRLEVLSWRVGCFLDRTHPEYYTEIPPAPEGRVFYMEELFYDNVAAKVTDADRAKMHKYYTRLGKRRAEAAKRADEAAAAGPSGGAGPSGPSPGKRAREAAALRDDDLRDIDE